jgi:hypothetical protein
MDIDVARHLFLLQKDSAVKKGVPFRLTLQDWMTVWGDKIDQRGSRPGDYYLERICKADGYVKGNLRITKRLLP